MLDARRSAWLPLQPLSSSTPAPSTLPGGTGDRSLPGGSCSIEALRDTFTPLYYSPACQLSPREVPIISHASTRDLAALLKLHVSNSSRITNGWGPAPIARSVKTAGADYSSS